MISFSVDADPIFQGRPRVGKWGAYDPNSADKDRWRWMVSDGIRKAHKLPVAAPLHVGAWYRLPIASSLSKVKQRALDGHYHTSRGDIDNLQKFSFDVMSGLVFSDDRFISSVYASKRWSSRPGVDFEISALGDTMIEEHALTVSQEITVEELEYMIKKANHLGLQHREIFGVRAIKEAGGKRTILFECDSQLPREHIL